MSAPRTGAPDWARYWAIVDQVQGGHANVTGYDISRRDAAELLHQHADADDLAAQLGLDAADVRYARAAVRPDGRARA